MPESHTPKRGAAGHAAFISRFNTPEERSRHFSEMAQRSHEGRVTLNREEAQALRDAYALIRRALARTEHDTNPTDRTDEPADQAA